MDFTVQVINPGLSVAPDYPGAGLGSLKSHTSRSSLTSRSNKHGVGKHGGSNDSNKKMISSSSSLHLAPESDEPLDSSTLHFPATGRVEGYSSTKFAFDLKPAEAGFLYTPVKLIFGDPNDLAFQWGSANEFNIIVKGMCVSVCVCVPLSLSLLDIVYIYINIVLRLLSFL